MINFECIDINNINEDEFNDFVGIRENKLHFNPTELQVPRIIFTFFIPLIWCRNLVQKLYWLINSIKGKSKK